MKNRAYIGNGSSLAIDQGLCIGCGDCLDVCPHGVIELVEAAAMPARKLPSIARVFRREGCMECGACARNCPVGAIAVQAGVGCAAAIIVGKLRGTEPTCDCGGSDSKAGSCC
jgi:NAD-dependent dihydropyrimidine dehydrogenase PreA subunit